MRLLTSTEVHCGDTVIGQGEAGVRGGPPGDLYVRLQVRPEG